MKTTYAIGIGIVALVIALAAVTGLQIMDQAGQSKTTTTQSNASTSAIASTTSTTGISSASTGSTTSTSSSTTKSTSSKTTSQPGGMGQFAMMATDPPITASGVTNTTVSYTGVAVHRAEADTSSGWIQLNGSGTINLMTSLNVSQTIAAAQIQSGTYDMARLNITSGTVKYKNQNYSAAIASGTLTVRLQNNVQVNSSGSSAALVDLRTFVLNTGESSQPQFVVCASAKGTAVPPSEVTSASVQVGSRTNLEGKAWWTSFEEQTTTKMDVSAGQLTSNSLNLQVRNTGNDSAYIQTVIVTPISVSGSANNSLPTSLSGSAVFTVDNRGSVQASNSLQAAALLDSSGTQLAAGTSTTLKYGGSISLTFGLGSIQLSGIVSGQQYLVTVMGANTYVSAVVVAQ